MRLLELMSSSRRLGYALRLPCLGNALSLLGNSLKELPACPGTSMHEAQCACWSDIDFTIDFGFRPKDKEEGIVPIHDALVAAMQSRHLRFPAPRLIFPG
jgi:hypothetical protein